jgi:UDPglucose--hexose-1-phosphate uridylyltransferase
LSTELRVDPLTGRTVAMAPGRSGRPGASAPFLDPVADGELESCPFCEGHEARTPPETLALPAEGRVPDTPGWLVRVVPNLYPAFERQEVVVHAPFHARSLVELDGAQLELIAEAWRLRAAAARADGFEHVFAFVNEGKAAGASLMHSHSQLLCLREQPPLPAAEQEGNGCRLCEYLDRERADGSRIVLEQDGLVLLCPYASRTPFECLVAPFEHEGSGFTSALLGGGLALAVEALRRLDELDGPRPANLWLHDGAHWHLELLPRLTVFASIELGAGLYVNTVPPEAAAGTLRG